MKSFSISRGVKISWFILLIGLVVLIGWLIFRYVEIDLLFSANPFERESVLISLPPIILWMLAAILVEVWGYTYLTARLVFTRRSLEMRSVTRISWFLRSTLKPFSIDYARIKLVRRNRQRLGVLDLVDRRGKVTLLAPLQFGKDSADEILAELHTHLAPECFEDGLDVKALSPHWTFLDKMILAIGSGLLGLAILTILGMMNFIAPIWFAATWKVESWPAQYERPSVYSVDQSSGFWVAAYQSSGKLKAYHYPNITAQVWELPKLEQGSYLQQVSGDQAGSPIVWLNDGILRYQNGDWSKVAYDRSVAGGFIAGGIVSGEQGWLINDRIDGNKRLLKIDALSGQAFALDLPAAAVQADLSPQLIRRALDGTLLVLLKKDTDTRVYLVANDQWQAQVYSVVLLANSGVRDLFLDPDRELWVLMETDGEWLVEKISPGGDFVLTRLPDPVGSDQGRGYSGLSVDAQQRLWVAGSDGLAHSMAVFMPSWMDDASLLQRYTSTNSNYRVGTFQGPFMSTDGRIWAVDNSITSMDTNLQVLPRPFPEWVASLFASLGSRVYIPIFITEALSLVFVLWILLRTRQFLTETKKQVRDQPI